MDKRTAYVEKLSAEMVAWDVEIERLKDKSESVSPEKRIEHAKTIAALQHKQDEAAKILQGVSIDSDHEWEDLKTATQRIWGEVTTLLSDAIKKS